MSNLKVTNKIQKKSKHCKIKLNLNLQSISSEMLISIFFIKKTTIRNLKIIYLKILTFKINHKKKMI